MENNAIMQRVMMLSEMWAEAVITQPQVRVFAWVGASSVEFKTIKGFALKSNKKLNRVKNTRISTKIKFRLLDGAQGFNHRSALL